MQSIVMRDRETGRSRGFGFVTFGSSQEADSAISGLNEQELDGRRIKVNIANARGGGGGGGGGGFGKTGSRSLIHP
ncbi:RNA-binding domain-containing protein [Schizopora paradoxa]|uniref:RNA-binding domain-containing protein n=1 Tax=Schizopora paradoxa TaxID=27342 RepID=A0A0H2RRV9_9AGAM|nr:RNA-binding domain-containing protein [Schizopora paradoxa]